jgi:cytochrome P450
MTLVQDDLANVDVASPSVYEKEVPHETLAALRAHDPVHWHPWPGKGGGFWLFSKHADVVAAGKDATTYSSGIGHISLEDREPDALEVRRSLIETDPPAHTRLRKIVSSAFTPRKVRTYEDYTREIAGRLLDRALEQGEFDFVTAISEPLPIQVIVSILGVPAEDADLMVELSNELAAATDPDHVPDPVKYPTTVEHRLLPFGSPAAWEIFEYGRRLGDERRRNPTEDLVSRLVHAEVDGERLSDQEYCNFFQLFVFAGNETTRSAISQGMLALMEYPGELERLYDDPSLMTTAVEEIIRWATPVLMFRRTATRDTEMRGVPIREGDKVALWYVSANFDDEVFADPFRFDLARRPNDQVSFGGGGPHFCLGAFLARLEIRVLLEEMLARNVRFEQTAPHLRLRSNFLNGMKSMPVRALPAR